ncbi:MAG: hypothetical protein QOE93_548, partial [Actinomycetota bacterium]|nr:hypothetical protein [Actinomycetota bacterium]
MVTVVAALVGATLLVVAPVRTAGAVTRVTASSFPLLVDPPDGLRPLPTGPSVDTIVDPVHSHVFISTWMPSDSLIVTDLAGTTIKVLAGLPGPRGMALGADGVSLYVALADGDAVATIDLVSLTERHRTHTGPTSCPQWLATAAGRLWVSYGCSGHTGAVAPIDPEIDVQALPDVPDSRYLTPPRLASASATGSVLAVAWGWWNGSLVDVFDVSGPAPVVIASRSRPEGLVGQGDVAVTPDATTVFVSGTKTGTRLAREGVIGFAASDLSEQGFYETGPYLGSIAVSPDGRHLAAAGTGTVAADLLVFPVGTLTPTHTRSFASSSARSVAWSPDGTTAYMPDTLTDGSPALHLVHGLSVDPGQIAVSAPPGVVAAGAPVIVSGHLVTTDGTPPTGLPMAVYRSGPDGTHPLPTLTTGAGGAFTLSDTPPGGGGYTYRFTWPGNAAHPPAAASGSVRVAGTPPAAALPAPPAGPGSDRPIGVAQFGSRVVDGRHGRLLASDPSAGIVAVLDLEGTRLGTIPGLPGADGMTLSPDGTTVYVALSAAAAVAAIDTALLVEVGRWSTLPFGLKPVEVAVAGGQLFFGYRWPATSRAGWGSLRLSAPAEVPTWDSVLGPIDMATFVTSPSDPDLLYSGAPTGSVYRMDASTTPPTVLASHPVATLEPGSQLSPDGIHLLRRGANVLDAATLATLSSPNYRGGPNTPYAGAYTTDGAYVAAAADLGGESVVRIWPRTATAPRRTFTFPGHVPFKGIAFTPDSSRLYAVTTAMAGDDSDPVLHVRHQPLADPGSVPAGDLFHALPPARILDTRDGTGGSNVPVGPATTLSVSVTGVGGVPPTGVTAVVLNVTATEPTAGGFLTVFPSDAARPLASNLNLLPAQTVPNLVVAKVGADGKVNVYNHTGTTHVIFDVLGWYSGPGGLVGARYNTLAPARILDTRDGTGTGGVLRPVGAQSSIAVGVTGVGGVPATGVTAVVLNVTATQPTDGGFVTVFPSGSARPVASNLNLRPGQTVPNLVVAKVGSDGKVNVYNHAGTTHVIFDVAGWFGTDGSAGGAAFRPLVPARILDTRDGTGGFRPAVGPSATTSVRVTGVGGVPAVGVSAVVLNVTATEPTTAGYLTVFPSGTPRPVASNLNVLAAETVPNLVVAKVGADGT